MAWPLFASKASWVSAVSGAEPETNRRISDAELAALRDTHARCKAAALAGDPDEYFYENEAFHACIYAASHNGFLASEARQLKQRLKPYRRLQLEVRHRMHSSLDEHQAIIDAIADGEAVRAEALLRDHLLIQGERFSDFVASVRRFESPRSGTG